MSRPQPEKEETRWNEAVGWVVALQDAADADLPHAKLSAFKAWARDPGNILAFDQVSRLEGDRKQYLPRSIPTAEELAHDTYDPSMSVQEWRALNCGPAGPRTASNSRRYVGFAVAASIAVATVALVLHRNPWIHLTREWAQAYETGRAASQQFVLADGSKITAAAFTRLSVRYTNDLRTITLDRGEALFEVAHNARQPFRVFAGSGSITAVGTAFDVRHDGPHVSVTVTEGSVEVRPAANFGPPDGMKLSNHSAWLPERVARGQRMSYEEDGGATAVEHAAPADVGWQDGQLHFEHERLQSVVAAVNRYSRRQITLDDSAAGEYLYSGNVLQDQVEDWIRGLERIYPLRIVGQDANSVHLGAIPEDKDDRRTLSSSH